MKGATPKSGSGGQPGDGNNGADPVYGSTPTDPNAHEFNADQVVSSVVAAAADAASSSSSASGLSSIASSEWFAYALMIVGWFILIRAISDFLRARRHEQLVLQSPERGLGIPVIATGEEAETVV